MPSTAAERLRYLSFLGDCVRDVLEVGKANVGECVIPEHRVDRFGEFCAARLVDATRIDPDPFVAAALRKNAALTDLRRDIIARVTGWRYTAIPESLDFLKGLLRSAPDM